MIDGVFVFALLPLGLFSLLHWREGKHTVAGFAWIAALAPLVISGVKAVAGAMQKKKQQKAEEANAAAAAQQAEEQRKQEWEQQQASPEANMKALQYKQRLGRLAGKMGGLNKVPPSILKALQSGYQTQAYQPGPAYRAPKTGASAWDYVEPAADVVSSVDWGGMSSALKGGGGGVSNAGTNAVAAGGGLNKGFSTSPLQSVQDMLRKKQGFGGTGGNYLGG
jgi:hypothetical protein